MSKRLDREDCRETQVRIRHRIGLTAALLGAIGTATVSMITPAVAQLACAPRTEVLEGLTKRYAEQSVGMGLASNGNVVELFAGKDGASWTIVITLPRGISCPVFEGESWENLNRRVAGRLS
jgi:hypothetical protein